MQLLYIWIEEDKNPPYLKDLELSFSNEYIIEKKIIEDKIEFYVTKNETNFIPNFFSSKIHNITGIIGKNGTGKTSLLMSIIRVIKDDTHYLKYIVFFKNINGDIFYYNSNNRIKKKIKVYSQNITKIIEKFDLIKEDINISYYASHIDFRNYPLSISNSDRFKDNSLYNQLRYSNSIENLENFKYKRTKEYLKFLANPSFQLPFEQPRIVAVNFFEANQKEIQKIKDNYIDLQNIFKLKLNYLEIFNQNNKSLNSDKKSIKWDFLISLLKYYIIHYIDFKETEKKKSFENIQNLLKQLSQKLEKSQNYISNELAIFIDFKAFFINQKAIPFDFNQFIDEIFNLIDESKINNEKQSAGKIIILPEIAQKLLEFENDLKNEIRSKKKYIKDFRNIHDFFVFDWQYISTGERYLWDLFIGLQNSVQANGRETNTIIIIDEGEVNLHPEWQRQYISWLIEGVERVFHDSPGKLQIILTSHSPFVISDLPKENVIFLDTYKEGEQAGQEKGNCKVVKGIEKEQTFGANIHTLLSDSFFMEGGLMGEFAKGKIQDVIDKLKECENNTESLLFYKEQKYQIKQIIDMIGEPLIKEHLLQRYNRLFLSEKESLKQQLKFIQDKLKKYDSN